MLDSNGWFVKITSSTGFLALLGGIVCGIVAPFKGWVPCGQIAVAGIGYFVLVWLLQYILVD